MASHVEYPPTTKKKGGKLEKPEPKVFYSREEMAAYKAKHLKATGHSPKGGPIYDYEEVKALGLVLREPKK